MTLGLTPERLERWRALSGVVPLGVFLWLHVLGNATVLWGRERFEAHAGWVDRLPLRAAIEIFGIVLPLLLHATLGMRRILARPEGPAGGGAGRDLGRAVQHATGLLVLLFVAVHLGHYRWPRLMGTLRPTDLFDRLTTDLQSMGRFAFYLAGSSATVLHFSLGLFRHLAASGRLSTPVRHRRALVACGAMGLVLWLLCLEVLGQHYAGGSVSGSTGILRGLGPAPEDAAAGAGP